MKQGKAKPGDPSPEVAALYALLDGFEQTQAALSAAAKDFREAFARLKNRIPLNAQVVLGKCFTRLLASIEQNLNWEEKFAAQAQRAFQEQTDLVKEILQAQGEVSHR